MRRVAAPAVARGPASSRSALVLADRRAAGPRRRAELRHAVDRGLVRQGRGRQRSPSRSTASPDRVEVLTTIADSPAPLVDEVPAPSGTGVDHPRAHDRAGRTATSCRTPRCASAGGSRPTASRRVGPGGPHGPRRRAVRLADARAATSSASTGTRAIGRSASGRCGSASGRSTRPRSCSASPRTEPVDFFIYADQDAFYDALGPGHARERRRPGERRHPDAVRAHPAVRRSTTRGSRTSCRTSSIHLVFDTAVKNPYHFPPRWLNEGLAVYLSVGYEAERSERGRVARPRPGDLIPLDGLAGQFPTSAIGSAWPTAESVSAVDFLVRDARPGRARPADPLVRGRSDRRRGVRGGDRHGRRRRSTTPGWPTSARRPPKRYGPQPAPRRPGAAGVGWARAAPVRGDAAPIRQPSATVRTPARCSCSVAPRGDRVAGSLSWSASGSRDRGSRPRPSRCPARDLDRPASASIPSWQVTLGAALLGLGFLIAAQLAAEGPRVRYTTQERSPLVETATQLQQRQDDAQGAHPRAARPDPGDGAGGRGVGGARPRAQRRPCRTRGSRPA